MNKSRINKEDLQEQCEDQAEQISQAKQDNQTELENKIRELEEKTRELEKFKKANEGLKESKMRMQLFMDNRNMQINTLNDQIKKYKSTTTEE